VSVRRGRCHGGRPTVFEPRETFVEHTGISGIDFGDHGGAAWHTELYLDDPNDDGVHEPLRGEVEVEGVDADGHITGVPGAYSGAILDRLSW
jgi:hypothetical protein